MRLFERGVEAGLIAAIERREVNRLERGIQLLLAFGLSFCIRCDDWAGRKKFRPQERRIRSRFWRLNRQLAANEFGLHVVSRDHSCRDEKFLTGLRIFGQKHGQNIVVAAAIKNRSVREDGNSQAFPTAKSQIERHLRALRGIAIDLLRNLDPTTEYAGSLPMLPVRIVSARP